MAGGASIGQTGSDAQVLFDGPGTVARVKGIGRAGDAVEFSLEELAAAANGAEGIAADDE